MEYDNYIEDRRVVESSVKTSWVEGKMEGKMEIALEMIIDGESNNKISKYTGLKGFEIDVLRKGVVGKKELSTTSDCNRRCTPNDAEKTRNRNVKMLVCPIKFFRFCITHKRF